MKGNALLSTSFGSFRIIILFPGHRSKHFSVNKQGCPKNIGHPRYQGQSIAPGGISTICWGSNSISGVNTAATVPLPSVVG